MSESIYSWIKEEPAAASRPARYVSRHDPTVPATGSTIAIPRKAAGTMGRSVRDTVSTSEFLRSGEKSKAPLPEPTEHVRTTPVERKSAVPRRDDRPVMGVKSTKNFIVANAVENILAVPRVRATGEPDYVHKADFGKVPAYLTQIKAEIADEHEFIQTMLAGAGAGEPGPRRSELPDDERAGLLDALKTRWDSVNAEYQRIAFRNISSSNATAGEIRRKEECERQLVELERDIERLSARGPIYVADE